jgi:hypothetical protein
MSNEKILGNEKMDWGWEKYQHTRANVKGTDNLCSRKITFLVN